LSSLEIIVYTQIVNDNSLGQDTNLSETEPKVFTSDAEFKN